MLLQYFKVSFAKVTKVLQLLGYYHRNQGSQFLNVRDCNYKFPFSQRGSGDEILLTFSKILSCRRAKCVMSKSLKCIFFCWTSFVNASQWVSVPLWLSMSSKGEERELNSLLLWIDEWARSCISKIDIDHLYVLKSVQFKCPFDQTRAWIFPLFSVEIKPLLQPDRVSFMAQGPQLHSWDRVCQGTEKIQLFSYQLNFAAGIARDDLARNISHCLKGVFWRTTWLNEADIPPGCLGFDTSLGRIFQRGLYLSTFYVVLGVPVKEVCHYFIKPS